MMVKTKQELHQDMVNTTNSVNEDLEVHKERIHELGMQVMNMLFYSRQKFDQLKQQDIRMTSSEKEILDLKVEIMQMKDKMEELQQY